MTWYKNPEHYFQPEITPDKETSPLLSAAAVALVNREGQVLLIKRPQINDIHGNDWVYPGGVSEPGELFDTTARRELEEEVGISLDEANNLFPLARYITDNDAFGKRHDLMIYVVQYDDSLEVPRITSPNEVVEWKWFYPEEALELAKKHEIKILPSGQFAIQRVKEYLSPSRQKAFNEVLIGGTFDRLHDGHRQLIAKAFEVGDYVYIGLTTDEYISRSSKKLKDIINPHNTRLAELRRYLFDQGLLSRSIVLPLNDTAGPKALDPRLEALIISEETIAGGDFVNNLRKENSAPALEIIVTPLLTDNHGQIISSTKKRESETQES